MTQAGLHHMHKRKRVSQKSQELRKLQPYPHPKKWINSLDKFLIFIAAVGPLTSLPQIYDIFVLRIKEGVSFATWALFILIAIPWLVYGLVHKDKPIIISSILWIVFELIVVLGLIFY